MPRFPKHKPGDLPPSSAAYFNALTDFANQGPPQTPIFPGGGFDGRYNPCEVMVRNDSGLDIARFGVLSVSAYGVLIEPSVNLAGFLDRPVLKGSAPSGPRFVVAQEPIPIDKIGRCLAVGITPVKIKVLTTTDAAYPLAAAYDTAYVIPSSDSGGAQILYRESGTGSDLRWAVVLLGSSVAESEGGHGLSVVQIAGTHTGGGKYDGYRLLGNGTTSFSLTSNLTAAEIGEYDTTDGERVIVINAMEVGTSGHSLPTGSHLPCSNVGRDSNTGRYIYVVRDLGPEGCV